LLLEIVTRTVIEIVNHPRNSSLTPWLLSHGLTRHADPLPLLASPDPESPPTSLGPPQPPPLPTGSARSPAGVLSCAGAPSTAGARATRPTPRPAHVVSPSPLKALQRLQACPCGSWEPYAWHGRRSRHGRESRTGEAPSTTATDKRHLSHVTALLCKAVRLYSLSW
jgi:hypothetical protein